jgi:putative ABC transport system permease protein
MRLNPVLALAWRNALRKKRRLALSLLLLAIGGGLFITAFNLGASWKSVLAESFAARKLDFQIRLVGGVETASLEALRKTVGEIETAEIWDSVPAAVPLNGKVAVEATYPDEAHGSFRAFAVEKGTRMVDFPLIAGRWGAGKGEVVLNQSAALRFPGIRVGDSCLLSLAGSIRSFTLVGIVRELGQAAAYLERSELASLSDKEDFRGELLIALSPEADKNIAKKKIEASLVSLALPVEVLIDNREFVIAGGQHFDLLIGIILMLGLVTGMVGWLGIASILALAVTERRREFGIIRTIGGTPRSLLFAVTAEAAMMTVLGTITAVLLSLPIAIGLGAFLGNLSARMPLPLVVDVPMALLWLALSLPAGIAASLGAGFRASRISIRETLHYV